MFVYEEEEEEEGEGGEEQWQEMKTKSITLCANFDNRKQLFD